MRNSPFAIALTHNIKVIYETMGINRILFPLVYQSQSLRILN